MISSMEVKSAVKKMKVTFISGSNLSASGGAELMLFEYIKRANHNDFDIYLVQPENSQGSSKKRQLMLEQFAHVIEIPDIEKGFQFFTKNRFTKALYYAIIRPILMMSKGSSVYRKFLQPISDSDIIYLFQNEFHSYLHSYRGPIIGHNGMWVIKERSVSYKLISKRIWWRRIDGFRLFPQNERFLKNLNRKYSFVLTNGIDINLFHPDPHKERSKKTVFLFAGRIEKGKGFDILINAFSRVIANIDCKLIIVGSGELEGLISKLPKDKVDYRRKVRKEEMPDIYNECDVLVHPARWDPYPVVVLEAAAVGLALLISESNKGSYDEFLSDGYLRYVPLDINALSDEIVKTADSIEEVREKALKNSKIAHRLHDINVVTQKLYNNLARITESYSKDRTKSGK